METKRDGVSEGVEKGGWSIDEREGGRQRKREEREYVSVRERQRDLKKSTVTVTGNIHVTTWYRVHTQSIVSACWDKDGGQLSMHISDSVML